MAARALSWLALAIAFSPVLAELAGSLVDDPVSRPVLVVPLLLLWCRLAGVRFAGRRSRDGGLWLAGGLALEMLGLAGGSASLARLGLPLAVLGLARLNGWPAARLAALAFGLVPVPHTVFSFTTPGLEAAWLRAAGAVLSGLGLDVEIAGTAARVGRGELQLFGPDGGFLLAAPLAWVGWASGLVRGAPSRVLPLWAGSFAAAGVLLQPVAVCAALLLLWAGSAEAARAWLWSGAWPTATLAAILYISARNGRNEGA